MSQLIEIKVPDIGNFSDVDVIEVYVKEGDTLKAEEALITLETDKATMDVPTEHAGVVKSLKVKVGDKVSEGSLILELEPLADSLPSQAVPSSAPAPIATTIPAQGETEIEIKVPDIGNFSDVDVIEVYVKEGDTLKAEEALITLETDKATMDVPTEHAGVVKSLKVKVGDKVSEGTLILTLVPSASRAASTGSPALASPVEKPVTPAPGVAAPAQPAAPASSAPIGDHTAFKLAHASPSVRRFARELGVDLTQVTGSGRKGRILQTDVQAFVKKVLSSPQSTAPAGAGPNLGLLPWPKVDFAQFGTIESRPLSRIKKLSGANLARNWVMIPHVTQFDEADITDLEAFRKQLSEEVLKSAGVKLTPLAFILKACVAALKKYPDFNSSLEGDNLILKHYWHLGFAADTPNGLVVPVIRDVDQKSLTAIAQELGTLSAKAREGKLKPTEMQGASFTVSSLGGIGGTAFTPIINAPEVAILGVSKTEIKPKWNGKEFSPRLMLPLSLSYDHRVIDGAGAARFTAYLAQVLADIRRLML